MQEKKAIEIHDLIWEHVSYSVLGMFNKVPKKLEYSLLEICQAAKIVSEMPPRKNNDGTSTYTTPIDERLIAAIYVANNYSPDNTSALVSYPNSHLILVDNKVIKNKLKK